MILFFKSGQASAQPRGAQGQRQVAEQIRAFAKDKPIKVRRIRGGARQGACSGSSVELVPAR